MNTVDQLKDKGKVTRGRIGVPDPASHQGAGGVVRAAEAGRGAGELGREGRPGGQGRRRGRRHHPQGRRPRREDVAPSCRGSSPWSSPARRSRSRVWRKGAQRDLAVTVAEMKDEARAAPQRRGGPAPKEKAKPNRMGLVAGRPHRRAEEGAEIKGGVLVEDVAGARARQRAARRRDPRHREPRPDDRGEERRAGQRAAGEARQGRVGDAAPEARRAAVLLDRSRSTNGDSSDRVRPRRVCEHAAVAVDAAHAQPAQRGPGAGDRGRWHAADAAHARVLPPLRRDARGAGAARRGTGRRVAVVDVDADPALEARYGERVRCCSRACRARA